jgi:hypothetical protein
MEWGFDVRAAEIIHLTLQPHSSLNFTILQACRASLPQGDVILNKDAEND